MASQKTINLHLTPDFPQVIMDLVRLYRIKMVYWDMGGVMVDLSRTTKEQAIEQINMTYRQDIDVEMFDSAIRTEWGRRESREAQEIIKSVDDELKEKQYWIGFYACVLRNLAIHVTDYRIVEWLATMQQNPESFEELPFVRATLRLLREIGIPIGIISNAFPSARKILERSRLIQEFNEQHIILSYEYNSIKPEPVIYQEAIVKAEVMPYEILFIDDRISFVQGAAKHGMKAVIIDDTEGRDVNGSGKLTFAKIKSLENIFFSLVWFWNRWLKGNGRRLARLKIGILWQ